MVRTSLYCVAALTTLASCATAAPSAVTHEKVRAGGAGYERGFADRRELLVNRSYRLDNPNRDGDVGKWTWSPMLAMMWLDRRDAGKTEKWITETGDKFIKSRYAGTYFKPFSCPGHAFYYFKYKDRLPKSQVDHARSMVRSKGFDQMSRGDGKMDPIYSYTEFDSENFNWMSRMVGLLWAHELNERGRLRFFEAHNKNLVRALYNAGRLEWNSNNYWGHTFNPIVPLYEFAPNDEIKERAAAIADWMVFEAAVHHLDGFQIAADTRAKTNAYKQFAGSVWAYAYLFWAEKDAHPTFRPEAVTKHRITSEAGYIAWTSYRPPQVAVDIAQRKFAMPVEIQSAKPFYHIDNDNYADWRGDTERSRRFEFETVYHDENCILASVATRRPSGLAGLGNKGVGGAQKPFCEQSVWRLGAVGTDGGAIQVFGNSGPEGGWGRGYDTMAQRNPNEQIGQHGNVMIRLIKNEARMWIAVPKEANAGRVDGMLFCDMGHGVYFAVIPIGAISVARDEFPPRKKKDPVTHDRFTWRFWPKFVGGMVVELGTKRQHGSYEGFAAAMTRHRLSRDGDCVEYVSTSGHTTRMRHTGVRTYRMVDGTVIDPAGKVPELWRDGVRVEYESWNSYEVVQGEKIIHQAWGSGELTAKVNGRGMKVVVDPATARVRYYAIDD